jgi:hypothetical protein
MWTFDQFRGCRMSCEEKVEMKNDDEFKKKTKKKEDVKKKIV